MDTKHFSTNACGWCRTSKTKPDEKSIKQAIAASKKKPIEEGYAILIARYQWLNRQKLLILGDLELPNLCLVIKAGKLRRAFYSDTLTHIIKKQRYNIQVLN